eukprot:SAG31_NODE_4011_length_3666_cov_1.234931_3_plen_928_part_00
MGGNDHASEGSAVVAASGRCRGARRRSAQLVHPDDHQRLVERLRSRRRTTIIYSMASKPCCASTARKPIRTSCLSAATDRVALFALLSPFLGCGCNSVDSGVKHAVRMDGAAQKLHPHVLWASEPAEPGQAVMVHGGNFGGNVSILLAVAGNRSSSSRRRHRISPLQTSPSSTKFLMPTGIPQSVTYELTISTSSGRSAPMFPLNVARVWWAQGDEGNSSTAGGWVRIFGQNLWRVGGQQAPTLRLQDASDHSAGPLVLNAVEKNASAYSAQFMLPAVMRAGEYLASVRGGFGGDFWTPLQFFVSPTHPRVSTISVLQKRARHPPYVFIVDANQTSFDYVSNSARNATLAVQRAIRGASEVVNGGDSATMAVVLLEEGGYFVDGPLSLPPRTELSGAGEDHSAVYFLEDNHSTAPGAYISCHGAGEWALRDMTIVVTGFYRSVVSLGGDSDGVRLTNLRIRANPFVNLDPDYRKPAFSYTTLGAALVLAGTNFVVSDCDIYSAGYGISTDASGSDWLAPTSQSINRPSFGVISRNTIKSGNNRLFLDGVSQLILEDNHFGGAGAMAGGVAMATYGRTHNQMEDTYGMDREVMTFDQPGWTASTYLGPGMFDCSSAGSFLKIVPSTTPGHARGHAPNYKLPVRGGVVVLMNGSHEGDWRRVVSSRDSAEDNSTIFELDRPWNMDSMPSVGSWVQISTFKGQCIFYRNSFIDEGPLNFWGHAIDNIVADNQAARIYGIYGTGIFEPWQPASEDANANQLPQPGSILLNLHNQFRDNVITDTNEIIHRMFSCRQLATDSDCHHLPTNMNSPNGRHAFAVVGQVGCLASCGDLSGLTSPNRFSVMHNNTLRGRGGFLISSEPPSRAVDPQGRTYGCPGGITDVLMQGNRQVVAVRGKQQLGEGFYSPTGREATGVLQIDNFVLTTNKVGRF